MIHPILAEYIETILNEYTIDIKAIQVSLSYLHIHIFINTYTYYIYYWPPIGRQRSVHFGHFVFHQVEQLTYVFIETSFFFRGKLNRNSSSSCWFLIMFFFTKFFCGAGGFGGFWGVPQHDGCNLSTRDIFNLRGDIQRFWSWTRHGEEMRCTQGRLSALTDFDLYRTTRWRPKKQIKVVFYLVYRFFWEVKKKQ